MGYIYKITNLVTNKIYIGQTNGSIKHRFATHKWNAKNGIKNYLYNSMRKYGIENFIIEEIEQCDNNILNDREKYWINFFDSCNKGYNLSIGGANNQQYDYKKIVTKYLELKNQWKTAQYFNCSIKVVQKACKQYNILINNNKDRKIENPKKVAQLDLKGNLIAIFDSVHEASQNNKDISTISKVCRGERKTAYGYKWKYI